MSQLPRAGDQTDFEEPRTTPTKRIKAARDDYERAELALGMIPIEGESKGDDSEWKKARQRIALAFAQLRLDLAHKEDGSIARSHHTRKCNEARERGYAAGYKAGRQKSEIVEFAVTEQLTEVIRGGQKCPEE